MVRGPIRRLRSFFSLEWVGEDDLFVQAFSEITPSLHLGRRPTSGHLDDLRRRRVTHVVSCLEARKKAEVDFLGDEFEQLFLPADDAMGEDLTAALEPFFDFVDESRSSDTTSLLVHCEVGVSRSASLVIALLMRDDGRSFLEAFEQVRAKRIQVLPNLAFASQLQQFEYQLQPNRVDDRPSSLATYLHKYCKAPSTIDELDAALETNDHDAPAALRSLYGGEIPRVVQGARSATS